MSLFDYRSPSYIPLHRGVAHLTNLRYTTRLSILVCIAKHVSEHLFCIFKSFCHLSVQLLFWRHIRRYGCNT